MGILAQLHPLPTGGAVSQTTTCIISEGRFGEERKLIGERGTAIVYIFTLDTGKKKSSGKLILKLVFSQTVVKCYNTFLLGHDDYTIKVQCFISITLIHQHLHASGHDSSNTGRYYFLSKETGIINDFFISLHSKLNA